MYLHNVVWGNGEKMIEIKNLNFSYGNDIIYENFNMKFDEKKVNVILGHNGAGKTTLLKLINGLLKKESGIISFAKGVLEHQDFSDIYYLPEDNGSYCNLTIYENIKFFKKIGYVGEKTEDDILKQFKLTKKKDIKVKYLSQGLIKRSALSNCTAYNASLLLLDEPTNGVDPETRDVIVDHIKNVKKDKTILVSTHDLFFASEIADRIIILNQGKVVLSEEVCNINIEKLKEKYFDSVTLDEEDL